MSLSDDARQALVAKARMAREHAHAPYSKYRVGAALLAFDGRVFVGVNVENSAYPTCLCAETNALGSAVAEGATQFAAIAVATQRADDGSLGAPCGNCRQAMSEFGLDLEVILTGEDGPSESLTLAELLPRAFSGADL